MNLGKLSGILGLLALVVLVALPGAARAEIYVEAFVGGVQPDNAGMRFITAHPGTSNWEFQGTLGKYDPVVISGLKVGTWFVKKGFLGFSYPDWMKYLGFYLEFSYHRLHNPSQRAFTDTSNSAGLGTLPLSFFSSEGMAATLAFMFAGRYGFFSDSEVPFGRLQPYLAVGPAIVFPSMEPKLLTQNVLGQNFGAKPGSDSAANIALSLDAGIRWMALKNVSIDIFYNFRTVSPTYSYRYVDPLTGRSTGFMITPGGNMQIHSGQVGVAYHF